jgi:endo-1,4-beta-xylanase
MRSLRFFAIVLTASLGGCSEGARSQPAGVGGSSQPGGAGGGAGSGTGGGATATGGASSGGAAGSTGGASAAGAAGTALGGSGAGLAGGGSGSGASGAAAGGSAGMPVTCTGATTLKEAGACTNRKVGVALSASHLGEAQYAERARQFNYVTAENEMKWDATEPSQGNFTFGPGDQIVSFAQSNGMAVKGHTLVWYSQLPQWVSNLTAEDDVRRAMVDHINGVMAHYKGKVIAWDVVNEVFEDDTNATRRQSVFQRALGDGYIEEAFRAARAADPDAKLYYNDYDIESDYRKADAAYEMVADLVAKDVPIDGVGMQMHTRSKEEDPPVQEFIANVERYLALGLEVVISEMDVRLCTGTTLEQAAQRYHDLVLACVARPGCSDITVWGITDQYSWLNSQTLTCVDSGPPRPLLWDDAYAEKPAYGALLDALMGR